MRTVKKLVSAAMAMISALSVMCGLSGCAKKDETQIETQNKVEYNAEMIIVWHESERRTIPTNRGSFSCNFWRENTVRVSYFNEDYDSDDLESKEYIFDENMPQSITHIVTTESEYNHIFDSWYRVINNGSIDFAKEMLIVYVHVGDGTRTYLKEAVLNGKELTIKYGHKIVANGSTVPNNATAPIRSVYVVKMDKLDIDTVRFVSLGRLK